jgi:hypothetical protein
MDFRRPIDIVYVISMKIDGKQFKRLLPPSGPLALISGGG